MQYIYLIQCNEYFKIGITNDVEGRIAQLSTGNPYKLKLISSYGFQNAEIVEKSLHQKFDSRWWRGEWFMLNGGDIEQFNTICEMLGGQIAVFNDGVSEETMDDAEVEIESNETIDDIQRVHESGLYNLEFRLDANKVIRGYVWRSRKKGMEKVFYVGRRHQYYKEVTEMLKQKGFIDEK